MLLELLGIFIVLKNKYKLQTSPTYGFIRIQRSKFRDIMSELKERTEIKFSYEIRLRYKRYQPFQKTNRRASSQKLYFFNYQNICVLITKLNVY